MGEETPGTCCLPFQRPHWEELTITSVDWRVVAPTLEDWGLSEVRWRIGLPYALDRAQPPLRFIPPAYSPWFLRVVHWVLPLLLRVRLSPWMPTGITRLRVINSETLADLYHRFQQGELRLLMAFRHVEIDDPLCGLYLLSQAVPQAARRQGLSLRRPLHVHFLYERGMPLWAGAWLGWVLSHLGGIPIRRGRQPDWPALRLARQTMQTGQWPMAVAPEGATNGHSEKVGPLEHGTAQLAVWCVGDLAKAHRSEAVYVIPVNIQYRYRRANWARLGRLLSHLEKESGLPPYAEKAEKGFPNLSHKPRMLAEWAGGRQHLKRREAKGTTPIETEIYARIERLGTHLLSQLEAFYCRFYHQQQLAFEPQAAPTLGERLQTVLEAALQVGEQYFGLTGHGNLAERCRRLEEAGWTYIYREDLCDRTHLSPLERGLADWVAQEASLRMLHMRLVETFVAVSDTYLQEPPSFQRCAEMSLLMFDLLARLRGDKLPRRPRLGHRQATLTVGDPISVTDRWPQCHRDHRAARRAVQSLTQCLQQSLTQMIEPS